MMKQIPYPLCAMLFLAASIQAQGIRARVVAETTLRVQAKNIVKTLPAKTDLSKGIQLHAKADRSNEATLVTTFSPSPNKTVFTLVESGAGQGWFQPNVRTGRHTILFTLSSPIPVQGTLRIQMTWVKTTFGHRAGGSDKIRVGAHSYLVRPPLATKVDQSLPVTLGTSPLEIRSTSEQWGSNNILTGTFRYECKLTFTPKMPCSLITYGKSCGSTLGGTAFPTREIQLALTGGFPKAAGLLVLGFERQSFTIPKTPCVLLTKIAFLGAFISDPKGEATWVLPLPPGIALTFQLQAATFARTGGQLHLKMTNGVEIHCTP